MQRKILPSVLKLYPNVFHGKFWDYKAKRKENHFIIYRRQIEGDPWEYYSKCAVVDGIIFVSYINSKKEDFEGIGDINERCRT